MPKYLIFCFKTDGHNFLNQIFATHNYLQKILIEITHNLPCELSRKFYFLEHLWLVDHIYFDSENKNSLFIITL